jgi:uncharacterized membrane protein
VELKPVVHYNGSLNFDSANALRNIITFIKCRLWGIILPLAYIFTLWSIRLFDVSGQTVNLVFFTAELIFATIAILIFRYHYNRFARAVTKIGCRVSITDEMVSVIPFTFNIFFVKQNSLRHLDFKINELKIRKTDNPLRFTRALDNRVFELRDKKKEAYIVFDYFDETLKEKLMEILVEVTPPELLRPGRMRHY